ncbi:hypothetical protein AVEN_24351-1 [Araneus ventricosus]|uniref:Uncharacterized protein n=1 Tax=Araneus ventricosus TaxID=182803 RepID=A0A4Y2DHZ9_ARAVE|nr:hypothetical protein AVEN_24351-1 [Araneus ventricosus]
MQDFAEETTQELVEGTRIVIEKNDCFPLTVVRNLGDWTRIPDTATIVLHLFLALPTMVAFITRVPLTDNNDRKIHSQRLSDILQLVKENLTRTITERKTGKFENIKWKKVETKLRNDIEQKSYCDQRLHFRANRIFAVIKVDVVSSSVFAGLSSMCEMKCATTHMVPEQAASHPYQATGTTYPSSHQYQAPHSSFHTSTTGPSQFTTHMGPVQAASHP